MEKKYIIFDLDGTLTDSYEGIINGFRYALSRFTVEPRPETFKKCIGPSIEWSLKTFYGFDDESAALGAKYFREYYWQTGYKENRVYDGIEDMLMTLRAHGKSLMVATSKPDSLAKTVLSHFRLDQYFYFIAGAVYPGQPDYHQGSATRESKEEVIRHVLKANGIFDIEKAVMVGDSRWDIEAAKKVGIQTIAVTYGFGDLDELIESRPDYLADSPGKLIEIIV